MLPLYKVRRIWFTREISSSLLHIDDSDGQPRLQVIAPRWDSNPYPCGQRTKSRTKMILRKCNQRTHTRGRAGFLRNSARARDHILGLLTGSGSTVQLIVERGERMRYEHKFIDKIVQSVNEKINRLLYDDQTDIAPHKKSLSIIRSQQGQPNVHTAGYAIPSSNVGVSTYHQSQQWQYYQPTQQLMSTTPIPAQLVYRPSSSSSSSNVGVSTYHQSQQWQYSQPTQQLMSTTPIPAQPVYRSSSSSSSSNVGVSTYHQSQQWQYSQPTQ
ncbi:hypothetical protein RIF29_21313 [Crotalaria pallida]|uniref:Uncharacterized protein n=1 Tax=Crotalaria pallida TaxID=3830 RepID=A0AAN9F4B6_CROPI